MSDDQMSEIERELKEIGDHNDAYSARMANVRAMVEMLGPGDKQLLA